MKTNKVLYVDNVDTPIGSLKILVEEDKLIKINFEQAKDDEMKTWINKHFRHSPEIIYEKDKLSFITNQIKRYFQGSKDFSVPMKFYGTDFQKTVWRTLLNDVPYGETRTYKQLAIVVGNPKASRAIGGAMNKNPIPLIVPCHRVIGSSGKLTGFGGGLSTKAYLLQFEKNNQ